MLGMCPRQPLSLALCLVVVMATMPFDEGVDGLLEAQTVSTNYTGQGTPFNEDEIQALVAPIALYPDALVAQVLNACTFPDQVAVAGYWLQQNKNLSGNALMTAVNNQSWDPSVKALTQFPTVLNNMVQNLAWTSQLGEAYHGQPSEVMNAVQALRAKAQAAGNLKSTSQITVVQQAPQIIAIQPANPQVVYVPVYNPTVVYGTPYVTPGYSTADMVATGLLSFGAGVAVGALVSGGCCSWGWSSWNCNWYHGGAYYHGYPYYGNNAWHGGYYGGANYYGNHPYNNAYDYNHPYNAYQSAAYHDDAPNSNYHTTNTADTHYADSGTWDKSSGGWASSDAARGWDQNSAHEANSTAFSSWGNHSGSSSFGSGGWGDRTASARGWGTRGGGGGWGGGDHSGGGNFRR